MLTRLENKVLSTIREHLAEHGESPTIAEIADSLNISSRGTVHRYVQSLIKKEQLVRIGNGWRGLRLPESPSVSSPASTSASASASASAKISRAGSGNAQIPGVDQVFNVWKSAADDPGSPAGTETAKISAPENTVGGPELSPISLSAVFSADSTPYCIPLAGQIAAGMPLEALPDEAHLDLSGFFVGRDRYALRVTGDSMVNAGILDGDTVIIRKQATAKPGDIVVALIDQQEATLKRLGRYTTSEVELIPENDDMPVMLYSAARVAIQGVLLGQIRCY